MLAVPDRLGGGLRAAGHVAQRVFTLAAPPLLPQSVARDIMLRLKDTQPDAGSGGGSGPSLRVGAGQRKAAASSKGGCC